jgi:hypothetical protein
MFGYLQMALEKIPFTRWQDVTIPTPEGRTFAPKPPDGWITRVSHGTGYVE